MIALDAWREEACVVDAVADAPIDGDGRAAARAVEAITDSAACARIWARARTIVLWCDLIRRD